MTTLQSVWTENQTLHSSSSVAAGASATDDIDLASNGYIAVQVQIQIAFGATPDGGVGVDVLLSPDSGTNEDTEANYSISIIQSTSTTKRVSILIENAAYAAIRVTNFDTTDAVTYVGRYAGMKLQTV